MNYATKQSAGLDLHTKTQVTVYPLGHKLVNVGKVDIPAGHVGFVMPKSGLSVKHQIVARLGVIDADYTGDIMVMLDNFGAEAYSFEIGDKVAQLVVVPMVQLEGYEVKQEIRGEQGFGHSGK